MKLDTKEKGKKGGQGSGKGNWNTGNGNNSGNQWQNNGWQNSSWQGNNTWSGRGQQWQKGYGAFDNGKKGKANHIRRGNDTGIHQWCMDAGR